MIQGESSPSFRATHLEMCKGIDGHGFRSTVEVPIIENTARECELTGRLREAILAFPKSNAVLVRRHGVYVWGSTWARAKAQAETYDYLFEAALQLKHAAGIDVSRPPPGWKEEGGGPPPPPPGPAAADPPPPPPSAKSPPRKVPAKKTPAKSQAPSGSAAAGGGNDDGPAQRRPRAEKARISPRRALLAVSPSSPLAPPPVLVDPSAPPKAIVLDIEGTVLPISYVKTKMFPFARQRFGDYLLKNYKKKEVREQLDALRKEQYADASLRGALSARTLQRFDVTKDFGEPANPEDYFEGYAADVILSHQHALELEESQHVKGSWTDAAQKRINKILPIEAQNLVVSCANKYLEALTDADVKSTALKAIQGSIWHEGFVRGELRAPLFADVPDALRRWARQKSIPVFIYSSGSKRAQIDLFAHTNAGDLSHCISGYFDTTSGAKVREREREKRERFLCRGRSFLFRKRKKEDEKKKCSPSSSLSKPSSPRTPPRQVNASSYQTILRALKVARAPSEVLFVTDILAEGAAAREAGWRVVMASRPGNAPLPAGHGFKEVRDFSREIF